LAPTELTERQQAILRVVREHISQHGYPPTVREIGNAVGLTSTSTVHAHLRALEQRGALRRDAAKPRAMELPDRLQAVPSERERSDVRVLPLVGRIAAGSPILAEENIEEEVAVPSIITASGDCFLLRVRGDSMVKAGILDDDYVVVRRQEDAVDGEIVAALVDGEEATVKRLRRVGSRVRLDPENDALEPFFPDRVDVMGRVVGVFRRL
jgi:repressor LexA